LVRLQSFEAGAPFRGRRVGSAGELPFAWIEEEAKHAFNVHGSGRELTRQSLVSLDDIKWHGALSRGHCRDLRKARRAFREADRCEAAKLPKPWLTRQDAWACFG